MQKEKKNRTNKAKTRDRNILQRKRKKTLSRLQCHTQNGDKMKEKQWQQHRVVVMHKTRQLGG